MSLKRLYLRIYNYSVQITFEPKIPICLAVINEYIRRFSWIYVTFVSCEIDMAEVTKIGDIPLTWKLKDILFNRKRWFYYSNQQTFCINNTFTFYVLQTKTSFKCNPYSHFVGRQGLFITFGKLKLIWLPRKPFWTSWNVVIERVKVSRPTLRIKTFGFTSRFFQC